MTVGDLGELAYPVHPLAELHSFEATLSQYEIALARLQDWGLQLSPTSRIASYRDLLRESIERDPPYAPQRDLERMSFVLLEISEIIEIVEAFETPSARALRRLALLGGTDRLNNLYPACIDCNLDKGTRTTRTARGWHGRRKAPLSREKRRQAKTWRGVIGGLIGGALGSLLGPWGAAGRRRTWRQAWPRYRSRRVARISRRSCSLGAGRRPVRHQDDD